MKPLTDEEVAAVIRTGASVADYANRRLGLGRQFADLSAVEVGRVQSRQITPPRGRLGKLADREM